MASVKNITKAEWKPEMDATMLRYHIIGCWVGIIFNALFFVTDYINIHSYWQIFLAVRLSVSALILVTLILRKPFKISAEALVFVPVLLISLQNAYMWSVMNVEQLQKHTLAYIALFIGSGLLVLYRTSYSVAVILLSLIANIFFFKFNSSLTTGQILANGGLMTFSIAVFSIILIKIRFRLTKNDIISRLALEKSNRELADKSEIINIKNSEIISNINYAQRIQNALIPPKEVLHNLIPESFIFFRPKDIVSGDFYWFTQLSTTRKDARKNEKLVVLSVADCTGHGVSGAFMSIIGLKILDQSIQQSGINSPAEVLSYLNKEIYNTVNKHAGEGKDLIRDGMDMAFCAINFDALTLNFAGANNPVYIVRNKELHEIKGDRQPIGAYESHKPFINHLYQLEKGDMVYIFSDGYADQFGGLSSKKLKYSGFKKILIDMSGCPAKQQKEEITAAFDEWKGGQEQIDDVCVIGIRI